jgi:hypothetical protein
MFQNNGRWKIDSFGRSNLFESLKTNRKKSGKAINIPALVPVATDRCRWRRSQKQQMLTGFLMILMTLTRTGNCCSRSKRKKTKKFPTLST